MRRLMVRTAMLVITASFYCSNLAGHALAPWLAEHTWRLSERVASRFSQTRVARLTVTGNRVCEPWDPYANTTRACNMAVCEGLGSEMRRRYSYRTVHFLPGRLAQLFLVRFADGT
ncbi:hypothetical protein B0T21DRAFT_379038 [Apiosordaria backusii]|uniref:Secreted protein n=1 Tax=Apiosordaria backusii TaxID=314023 RepID=A0AA40DFB6_9PEZI|nr:hypothetical protein B0T21DRAFT_379038 [Apiosordaria backusii]